MKTISLWITEACIPRGLIFPWNSGVPSGTQTDIWDHSREQVPCYSLLLQKIFSLLPNKSIQLIDTMRPWFVCLTDPPREFKYYFCFLEKIITQRESCKLSLIRGKMRTAAQEAAFPIALRHCSGGDGVGVGGSVQLGYVGVLQKRVGRQEHQKITAN